MLGNRWRNPKAGDPGPGPFPPRRAGPQSRQSRGRCRPPDPIRNDGVESKTANRANVTIQARCVEVPSEKFGLAPESTEEALPIRIELRTKMMIRIQRRRPPRSEEPNGCNIGRYT